MSTILHKKFVIFICAEKSAFCCDLFNVDGHIFRHISSSVQNKVATTLIHLHHSVFNGVTADFVGFRVGGYLVFERVVEIKYLVNARSALIARLVAELTTHASENRGRLCYIEELHLLFRRLYAAC